MRKGFAEGKGLLGRRCRRQEHDIIMDFRELG